MNWKRFYMVLIALATTSLVNAQANLLNAKKVDEIGKKTQTEIDSDNDKPLPYGYINDRDVLWSKVVWEYVDLNQKINLPYYYPIDTSSTSNSRRSLFDTLMRGIRGGKIKEVYSDSYFTTKIGLEEIKEKTVEEREIGGEDGETYKDVFTIKSEDIKGFLLKGIWYFDKRQGELKYRLLGLAPMGPDILVVGREDVTDDKDSEYELFWVFYPDARETLHESRVFNPKNSAHPISYDNLLNARRFNSIIRKEENLYGDRKISDYIRGNSLFQLLEADRIKEGIRDREMDMWNY